jgi:hypothetical protein
MLIYPHNRWQGAPFMKRSSQKIPLLGMWAVRHRDPRARASPSEVNHSEPSLYDNTYDTPSHFLLGKLATRRSFSLVEVGVEPDRTEDSRHEGRSHRRLPPHKRPQGGDGWSRRSSVHRRSLSLASQRSAHASCPHWWGTEIFVNHKGL